MILALLGFFLCLALVLAAYQFLGPFIMPYQLRENAFFVALFGFIPVVKIPYDRIEDVREISLADSIGLETSFSLRAGNRIFGKIVYIRTSFSLLKSVIIADVKGGDLAERIRKRSPRIQARS